MTISRIEGHLVRYNSRIGQARSSDYDSWESIAMEIILCHGSALLFWRRFTGDVRRLPAVPRLMASSDYPTIDDALLRELAGLGIAPPGEAPLHLLFANPSVRPKMPGVVAHLVTQVLPPNSFLRLSPHVLIVSPELCFVQMADVLSFGHTALIGCELCGSAAQVDGGLPDRRPLTSAAKISTFLAAAPRLGGAKQAKRVLPHLVDNAASPMEARLALLLSAPTRLGGYGLPKPEMNRLFGLSREAQQLYPHDNCACDLFWPDRQVDVEYHGAGYHADEAALIRDTARTQALQCDGVSVVPLTYPQIADAAAFDSFARTLAKSLAHRIRIRSGNHPALAAQLRAEMGL